MMNEGLAPEATSAAILADAAVGVLTVAVKASVEELVPLLEDVLVPDEPPPQDAANAATRQQAVIRHDRVLHFRDELMVIPPGIMTPPRWPDDKSGTKNLSCLMPSGFGQSC